MLWLIWKGILLGLGVAAPVGPVNVEIARRALREGFRSGFLLGCGAVTVDVTLAALVTLSIRPVVEDYPRLTRILSLLGAALLLYLSYLCFRSAFRQRADDAFVGEPRHPGRHYLEGVFMNALNPYVLAFWFTFVPGQVGTSPHPQRDLPVICTGVFIGTFGWVCAFTSFMTRAGQAAKRRLAFIADLSGGVMLLGFALVPIWRAVRPLL